MKVASKLAALKRDIDFIAMHDDAESASVEGILLKGKEYIDEQIAAMKVRRGEKTKRELADLT